jgi:Glyoxalase-like domain
VEGGRHPGLGTENRIVALGDAYIELLGLADRDEAASNPFGSRLLEGIESGEGWLGWCVRTDDLDGVCARLGLEPSDISRERPDGTVMRARLAGLAPALEDPWRPFFIQRDGPPEEHPSRAGGMTQAAGARIAAVEVGGDEDALREWAGELPGTVRVADGPPGVHTVTVAGEGGIEVLR